MPDALRRLFAPHVRIYTQRGIRDLFHDLDVEFTVQSHIFPGFDNWAALGPLGRLFRDTMHSLEQTPLRCFGISHFVIARKVAATSQE